MSRILVVEDDDAMREALCEVLANFGHSVEATSDGAAALESLRANPAVDVVVLDLMMPRMNGYDFCKAQRRDSRLAAIPVIVCTAQRAEQGRYLLGTRILSKPLRLGELLRTIDEV